MREEDGGNLVQGCDAEFEFGYGDGVEASLFCNQREFFFGGGEGSGRGWGTGRELFDVFFGAFDLFLEGLDCRIHFRQFTVLGNILIIL